MQETKLSLGRNQVERLDWSQNLFIMFLALQAGTTLTFKNIYIYIYSLNMNLFKANVLSHRLI